MKSLGMIIFYLLMVGVGYVLYPIIIPKQEEVVQVEKVMREVVLADGRRISVDLGSLEARDFPDTVSLSKVVRLSSQNGSTFVETIKGQKVRPLSIKGRELTITDADLTGVVDVNDTNFESQVLTMLAARYSGGGAPSQGDAAPKELTAEEKAAMEMAAVKEAERKAAAEAEAMANKEAEAAKAAEEAAAATVLDAEAIVELMKSSLGENPLTEFSIDQVKEYKAGDDEEFEGESYQTGIVLYEADSIFGKLEITAKALITGGKIEKWVSPETGIQLQ